MFRPFQNRKPSAPRRSKPVIPEPHPYPPDDPDDPDWSDETIDGFSYRFPGPGYPDELFDFDESMLY